MTDYNVLYYPDFVPDPLWLRRVLLLTDGVVRIVPDDVVPKDPDEILRLQDAAPDCLTSVPPTESDVSVDYGEEPRLAQFFEVLAEERRNGAQEFTVEVSQGKVSVPGHVFVHDAKLSDFVIEQLRRHGLIMEDLGRTLAGDRFVIVDEGASDLILSGVAARMARRLGIDAMTDERLPFALNSLRTVKMGPIDAEGTLLSALARVSIPDAVEHLPAREYVEFRKGYAEIRECFKELTASLAAVHRLTKLDDPIRLLRRVDTVAKDFERQLSKYESSRFARRFATWTPLFVGAALTIPASLVSPEAAAILAGGCIAVQAIEKCLETQTSGNDKVLNMLTDLRKDLIERSQISRLA